MSGWATVEAARQCAPSGARVTKTWVTGRNPRPEHARLNGVTVGIDDPFPNGADWPGDVEHLTADQVANCNCQCAVTVRGGAVESGDEGTSPTDPQPSGNSWSGMGFARHMRSHGRGDYGLDPSSPADQMRYMEMANDVIENYDAVGYSKDWSGYDGDTVAFYFKGVDTVLVSLEKKRIISLFKYKEGRNAKVTAIWHSVHE